MWKYVARAARSAVLLLAFCPGIASGQAFPDGLAAAHRALFEEYDRKLAAAIRQARDDGLAPLSAPAAFSKRYGRAAVNAVFGADWAPIEAYADAALAALPTVDPAIFAGKEPLKTSDMLAIDRQLDAGAGKVRAFEAGLATGRFWEPLNVMELAATVVLAQMPRDFSAFHATTRGFASEQAGKTTWRGRPALVLFQGGYIFVTAYIRTPSGLIWATEIGLYER